MLKNSKSNKSISSNNNDNIYNNEYIFPKNKHMNNPKYLRKKELKAHISNSVITLKNSEISKKISKNLKNKYHHKSKKSNEKKILNISAKMIKNTSKEKDKYINCISNRKKKINKQSSFISKISNDNLPSTIEYENLENKEKNQNNKKIGRHLSMRGSDIKRKKMLDKLDNKNINIELYLKELRLNKQKKISINKQKEENKNEKYLSNKINKNSQKIKTNNNFSLESSKNKNSNIINTNLSSFSPVENPKSKKIYKISTKSKTNVLYFTNPNNNDINNNKNLKEKKNCHNSNSIKSKNKKNKNTNTNSNKNIHSKVHIFKNNSSKNIKENYNNIITRNYLSNNVIKDKGVLKPFCSMINIPLNNKIKRSKTKEKNKKENYINSSNYSTGNENNNYIFDKNKYFNDFKNRFNKKNNYLSEENTNKPYLKKNNIIKKIKNINIINSTTNKNEEEIKEDALLKKNKKKKKLTVIDTNYLNSINNGDQKKTKNSKNSFTNINKRNSNEEYINSNVNTNNINKIHNSFFQKNKSGRNITKLKNIFEPQTTTYQKNHIIYKNKNSEPNPIFNIYTQTMQDTKSFTIEQNKDIHRVIKSGRNNKNKIMKINSTNDSKTNYLKIVSLFDKLKKYKNRIKLRKNQLEICFLNNSNINTNDNTKITYTNINNNNNNYLDNINMKINQVEIDENKIKENISHNTLTMFTIYILSKYYQNCDKIGLSKILILDKNGKDIPIVCYNINCNLNNKQEIGISSVFNFSKINNNFSLYECYNKDIPLIIEFKNNIYINFYIKKINIENIEYIQINNYSDLKNNISPIKNIEIFKGNQRIYIGILQELNSINKIFITNNAANNKKVFNSVINNKNIKIINDIKEKPLSSSKQKSNYDTQNTKTSTYRKSEVGEYYTKRNIFKKPFKKNFILIDNKENNNMRIDYYKKQNDYIYSGIKKYSTNDIRNTKLVTGNLKQEINISNTYTINNMTTNNIQKTYYDCGELFTNNTNSEISNNIRNNNVQKIYNISSNNNINYEINTTDDSYFISGNKKVHNLINDYDNNEEKNENKILMKSNSEKKFKKPLIKTQRSILFQKISEENNKDIFNHKLINNNHQSVSINKYINQNYIEFNKIHFVLRENYGNEKLIGLTGLELYNNKNKLISIETASSIGALPKDLKTIYNDNEELRIFENVFNNCNNTNDIENMWVTKYNKSPPYTFIEICFEERIKLSRIKIYNYNEKEKLCIGVKFMDIYLDDIFYKSVFIKQGCGEIAYDYIKIQKDKENNMDNSDENKNYDFGQNIYFPITKQEINKNNNINNEDIKYASALYEQSYEVPYLPCCYIIKIQFISNYYKGISFKDELDILKYNDIGVDSIDIFDYKGNNLLSKNRNDYKIISNCELFHNDENKIILNGTQNDFNNNSIFFIFNDNVRISLIKFYPLTKKEKNQNVKSLNSLQELRIFCDKDIVFEGQLYLSHPTIILFTSDNKIIKNINEKYITKNIKNRECKEIFKEDYTSLVFH